MKIALINAFDAHDRKQHYFPALGLGYLAAYVKEQVPGRYEFLVAESRQDVLRAQPDLVGISTTSQAFELSKAMAGDFKESLGVPVVLGGVHITALPETLPRQIDIAVLGEGEETFFRLLQLFERHGRLTENQLADFPNVAYWRRGQRVINPRQRPNRPIDNIPFPDRSIMKKVVFQGGVHMIASRGCPYDCSFCYNRTFWLGVSAHSPLYFAREVAHLIASYKPAWIYVYDDLFLTHPKRLRKIVNFLEAYHIPQQTAFRVYLRANALDDEVCNLLRRMNVRAVDIGFESNSARVLAWMNKRTTPEVNQRCLDLCHRNEIDVYGTFIIGWPGEQPEDVEASIRFIERNKHKFRSALTIPLYPYPGTRVWNDALRRGLVSTEMDFNRIQTSTVDTFDIDSYIMLNPDMSREKFEKYLNTFFALHNEILPAKAARVDFHDGLPNAQAAHVHKVE
jgi:anaerobic magnesium-protoporphyrin IX monomethyl ester cyclase